MPDWEHTKFGSPIFDCNCDCECIVFVQVLCEVELQEVKKDTALSSSASFLHIISPQISSPSSGWTIATITDIGRDE
jgi:hypothetical protein